jgi:hypothetical protein
VTKVIEEVTKVIEEVTKVIDGKEVSVKKL